MTNLRFSGLCTALCGLAMAVPLALAGAPATADPHPGFQALFTAETTGAQGVGEYWLTEGLPRNTRRARLFLHPGYGRAIPHPSGNYPHPTIALPDGTILLSGYRVRTGNELYVTDGTRAGTRIVQNLRPDGNTHRGAGSRPDDFFLLDDGRVLFSADRLPGRELWITDTTRPGTRRLHPEPLNPRHFAPLGDGRVVFQGTGAGAGAELWVTDGTRAGTGLVADLRPGPADGAPQMLVSLGDGKVLFAASPAGSVLDTVLMVTDGTAAGTVALTTDDGEAVERPDHLTALGDGRAVLWARVDGGWRMLVTDGTAAGTLRLNPPRSGTLYPVVGPFVSIGEGGAVYRVDRCLMWCTQWRTDLYLTRGRPDRHRRLFEADMFYGGLGVTSADLGDGRTVFAKSSALFVTDGTPRGTRVLTWFPTQAHPQHITATGDGRALLQLRHDALGYEPWITDGTRPGTRRVQDLVRGTESSRPANFTVFAPQ